MFPNENFCKKKYKIYRIVSPDVCGIYTYAVSEVGRNFWFYQSIFKPYIRVGVFVISIFGFDAVYLAYTRIYRIGGVAHCSQRKAQNVKKILV